MKKSQVIHNESLAELTRLQEEYEFIGRKSKIDTDRMTLTVFNTPRKKRKPKRLSSYEKIDKKYS